MLKLLAEDKEALFILTSGNNPDSYATSDELYEYMKKYTTVENIHKKSIEEAIEDAMNSNVNTVNFVIGSFYTYGTVVNKIEDIKNEIINIKLDKNNYWFVRDFDLLKVEER